MKLIRRLSCGCNSSPLNPSVTKKRQPFSTLFIFINCASSPLWSLYRGTLYSITHVRLLLRVVVLNWILLSLATGWLKLMLIIRFKVSQLTSLSRLSRGWPSQIKRLFTILFSFVCFFLSCPSALDDVQDANKNQTEQIAAITLKRWSEERRLWSCFKYRPLFFSFWFGWPVKDRNDTLAFEMGQKHTK